MRPYWPAWLSGVRVSCLSDSVSSDVSSLLILVKFVFTGIQPKAEIHGREQLLQLGKRFLPKFRNFNRSFLLNFTRSPRVSTSAAFRQLSALTDRSRSTS